MAANLLAKVTLTADGAQLVGEATKGSAALDKLAVSAERAGAGGAQMGAGLSVGTAAIAENGAAAAALTTETAALGGAQAAVGVNSAALERLLHSLGHEAGVSRTAFSGVVATLDLLKNHPVITTLAALATVAVAAAAAWDFYETSTRRVESTAQSMGNMFNLTRNDLEQFRQGIADTADVSEAEAAKMERSFLSINLPPKAWNDAAAASKELAGIWQTDVPTAAQKLAEALKDPATAGEQLLESFNALDGATKQQIDTLVATGHSMDATDILLKRIKESQENTVSATDNAKEAWNRLSDAIGTAAFNLGNWIAKQNGLSVDAPLGLIDRLHGPYTLEEATSTPAGSATDDSQPVTVTGTYGGAGVSEAEKNRLSVEAVNISRELLGYETQLADIENKRKLIGNEYTNGVITLNKWQQEKARLDLDEAKAIKAHNDELLNLNEDLKAHVEQVKEAVKEGEKLVASSQLEADWQTKIAAAALDGASAQAKVNDEYQIAKAVLPLTSALRYADAAAAAKLHAEIDGVTAAMRQQQAAQHAAAAVQEVRSGIGSIGGTVFGGVDMLGLSTQMGQAIKDAVEWRNTQIEALQKVGEYTEDEASRIELVFRDKISKPINQAVSDIRSGIASLSDNAGAKGFALMYQESIRAAEEWRDKTREELSGAEEAINKYVDGAGGDLSQYDALLSRVFGPDYKTHLDQALAALKQYGDDVDVIFNDKLAKAYEDDLNRRTDWAAGVQRASLQMTKDTQNMAKFSETALKDFDAEGEKIFTDLNMTGKERIADLVNFILEQLVKLAYQRFLAGSINQLGTSLFDMLGNILGAPGGDGGGGSWVGDPWGGFGGHAAGTDYSPGGWKWVGEQGPELMRLPRGTKVVSHTQSMDFASQPIVVNLPASSGAGAAAMPKINIIHHDNVGVKLREGQQRQNPDGSFDYELFIDGVDKSLAARHQRGQSVLGNMMGNMWGLKRGAL